MTTDNLDNLRQEIDATDEQIIALIAKRMGIVKRVGKYKAARNIPPLDEKRWKQVLEKIAEKAKNQGVSETLIKSIYEEIHQEALVLEKQYE